jgi:hypothetical protein
MPAAFRYSTITSETFTRPASSEFGLLARFQQE